MCNRKTILPDARLTKTKCWACNLAGSRLILAPTCSSNSSSLMVGQHRLLSSTKRTSRAIATNLGRHFSTTQASLAGRRPPARFRLSARAPIIRAHTSTASSRPTRAPCRPATQVGPPEVPIRKLTSSCPTSRVSPIISSTSNRQRVCQARRPQRVQLASAQSERPRQLQPTSTRPIVFATTLYRPDTIRAPWPT